MRLLRVVAVLGDPDLSSEERACNAFVAARWPKGTIRCPHCGAPCQRQLAHLRCIGRRSHRFTVFFATPLGTKLKPNVRATLLALRAMIYGKRSISARELARETGMNHVTLWRHMHSIRAVLPRLEPIPQAPIERETFRTWVNGTFHGVTDGWRHRYRQERDARRYRGEPMLWTELAKFIVGFRPFTLAMARSHRYPDPPPPRRRL